MWIMVFLEKHYFLLSGSLQATASTLSGPTTKRNTYFLAAFVFPAKYKESNSKLKIQYIIQVLSGERKPLFFLHCKPEMQICTTNVLPGQVMYSFIRKSVPDDISSSFKVRDDDLSSKQGSLCTFKIMLIK